jgi:hypothetical protein
MATGPERKKMKLDFCPAWLTRHKSTSNSDIAKFKDDMKATYWYTVGSAMMKKRPLNTTNQNSYISL